LHRQYIYSLYTCMLFPQIGWLLLVQIFDPLPYSHYSYQQRLRFFALLHRSIRSSRQVGSRILRTSRLDVS
ncbi:hypothetical protein CP061683_0477B, partial [Chlamydia psittaci 06-1683]